MCISIGEREHVNQQQRREEQTAFWELHDALSVPIPLLTSQVDVEKLKHQGEFRFRGCSYAHSDSMILLSPLIRHEQSCYSDPCHKVKAELSSLASYSTSL